MPITFDPQKRQPTLDERRFDFARAAEVFDGEVLDWPDVRFDYGELRIVLSKAGMLLQLSSRLIPALDFPARPKLEQATITSKLVGREFTYSNFAGQPLTYKVAQASEISFKELVVFPKVEEQKIKLHLVYPVEVGRGTTWTVYVDAVTGEEVEVKQNFQS